MAKHETGKQRLRYKRRMPIFGKERKQKKNARERENGFSSGVEERASRDRRKNIRDSFTITVRSTE